MADDSDPPSQFVGPGGMMSEIDELKAEVRALRCAVALLYSWQHRVTDGHPDERKPDAPEADDLLNLLANEIADDQEDNVREIIREIGSLAARYDRI